MPRGGPRPGAGRKPGSGRQAITLSLSTDPETARLLERLQRRWECSRSEAVRRAIRQASDSK